MIAIRPQHVAYLDPLPWHHRDSYGRIPMAQAMVEKMILVTEDAEIRKYDLEMLAAG